MGDKVQSWSDQTVWVCVCRFLSRFSSGQKYLGWLETLRCPYGASERVNGVQEIQITLLISGGEIVQRKAPSDARGDTIKGQSG